MNEGRLVTNSFKWSSTKEEILSVGEDIEATIGLPEDHKKVANPSQRDSLLPDNAASQRLDGLDVRSDQ
ncbi:hypothetical protein J6590_083694 [Homalodisca vitripennis]|nr:hypothetical protein J6590_083694 [Homalodisca vitripennis]